MAQPVENIIPKDYVLGMLALTRHGVPFGHHCVRVSAYTVDDALYAAIVRVMALYDDPRGEGLLLRTVYIAAATETSTREAHKVAADTYLRTLPMPTASIA